MSCFLFDGEVDGRKPVRVQARDKCIRVYLGDSTSPAAQTDTNVLRVNVSVRESFLCVLRCVTLVVMRVVYGFEKK